MASAVASTSSRCSITVAQQAPHSRSLQLPAPSATRRPLARRAMAVCRAQTETEIACEVVSRQLELYNSRDVDAFMSIVTDDVLVTDAESGKVLANGKEALRPRYVERFKTPVHCALLGRVCCGATVVDREIITGLPDDGEADCMAIYTVDTQKRLIKTMQFVWRPRTRGVKL